MKIWWVGWVFPDKYKEDERIASAWPDGVKGWVSGQGFDDTTWVGRVEAPNADSAKTSILLLYRELAEYVEWRWEPQEKPNGWKPSDRFPM